MDNPAFDFPVDPYITDADNEFSHSAPAFADDCLPPRHSIPHWTNSLKPFRDGLLIEAMPSLLEDLEQRLHRRNELNTTATVIYRRLEHREPEPARLPAEAPAANSLSLRSR